MVPSHMRVRIHCIRYEARDVLSFSLRSPEGNLPLWTPGSHIDVHLPNGLVRSYSLSNAHPSNEEYRFTVQLDSATRGGSKAMHETLRVGQFLEITPPRNNFELCETAERSVFFAGGIGVAPLIPMTQRLSDLGRRWTVYYCIRTPDRAAHVEELERAAALNSSNLILNYDEIPGGRMLDLPALIGALKGDTHLYCCGPDGMLNSFRKAAAAFPSEQVHFEYFSSPVEAESGGGFIVELAKSGREINVKPGQTILEALRDAGVEVASSCEEGVCGTCETRVLAGKPEHRDLILSERERAESRTMMICCSGSLSDRLVLDL